MNTKAWPGLFRLSLTVLLFQFSQTLSAAGLYISEIASPASVGTAGVFNVVNNLEASSAFTNPAGMTGLKQDETMIGLQLAIPEIRFDSSVATAGGSDGGNAGEVAGIPGFFWVKGMTDKWKLGFSAVAPIGGGVDYGDDFVGRYQATEAFLSGLALSGSGGYKLNDDTSIGFGLSAVYQIYELGIAINRPGPLSDAKVEIEDATDWGFQPFFGLTHQINDRLMLGFTYRAEFDVDLEGDLKFKNTGPLLNLLSSNVDKATFGLDYVDAYTLGFKYDYRDDLTLFFDVNYEAWSNFSENRIDIQGGAVSATIDRNWDDTWHIGFGFVRELSDNRLFSFGVAYDSSPVDDEDRTADLPADEQFKFALGWSKVKPDRVRSIGLTFIHLGDNRIDQTTQGVRFAGKFDPSYLIFASYSLLRR